MGCVALRLAGDLGKNGVPLDWVIVRLAGELDKLVSRWAARGFVASVLPLGCVVVSLAGERNVVGSCHHMR